MLEAVHSLSGHLALATQGCLEVGHHVIELVHLLMIMIGDSGFRLELYSRKGSPCQSIHFVPVVGYRVASHSVKDGAP